MKSSFKRILFVLPLFIIGTLLSHPPFSSGRGDLRQVYALGLKDQLNGPSFKQNTEPFYSLKTLQQMAQNVTNSPPRIAIVGAGIAGLTAAYRLNQMGYASYVYEGSERNGGRILSAQFPNGQMYEKGAELISASDMDILTLIQDLHLTTYLQFSPTVPPGLPFTEVIEYQDPDPPPPLQTRNRQLNRQCIYTTPELVYDWMVRTNPNTGLTIYQQMSSDATDSYPPAQTGATTPWPVVFPNLAFTAQLDSMTLDEYVDSLCSFLRVDGDGSKSKLAQYFKARFTGANGTESINQSPLLGFIWEIIFGASGDTYHITGGNSQVNEAMVQYLANSAIETPILNNYRLIKIKLRTDLPPIDMYGNFPYELTFDTPEGIVTPPVFDHIILANPFVTYRQSDNPNYNGFWIDISEAGFSDLKVYAIQNLPMGISSKVNVQFTNRFWVGLGNNGFNTATSNPSVSLTPEKLYQITWEASSGQPGTTGILIDFKSGQQAIPILNSDSISSASDRNSYFKNIVQKFLYQLDVNLPGALSSKNFKFQKGTNNFIYNVNTTNRYYIPWTRGSYPYTAPTQIASVPAQMVMSFWGYCGVPEPYTVAQTGNCHFAGDGTTYNQIGFMNAAVVSGGRVVAEILSDL